MITGMRHPCHLYQEQLLYTWAVKQPSERHARWVRQSTWRGRGATACSWFRTTRPTAPAQQQRACLPALVRATTGSHGLGATESACQLW